MSARTLDSVVSAGRELWEGTGAVDTHSPNDVLLAKDLKPTLAVGFFSPARRAMYALSLAQIYALSSNRGS